MQLSLKQKKMKKITQWFNAICENKRLKKELSDYKRDVLQAKRKIVYELYLEAKVYNENTLEISDIQVYFNNLEKAYIQYLSEVPISANENFITYLKSNYDSRNKAYAQSIENTLNKINLIP